VAAVVRSLIVAALLSSGAAPAFAQQASPGPSAPATPAPPAASPGLEIFGRYVGEYAGNTSGGFALASAYASEFQLGANYRWTHPDPLDAGTLHFIFTERWGSGLTPNAIGNVASVQEIFGAGLTPRLTELDYEQTLPLVPPISGEAADSAANAARPSLDVHAGRVIMQNDFAASSTYWGGNLWCSYQSNAICGTPVAAPNNSGYGYYPASEWGAYAKISPAPTFYVQTGAFQVDPLYGNRGEGFDLGLYGTTGVMFPLELGFLSYDGHGAYDGSVRIGGYFDTSDVPGPQSYLDRFVPAQSPALAQVPSTTYRGRSGAWLLVDRLVAGSSAPNARGAAVWAAYEYGDADTALISNFVDAGIVQHGTFRGRDDDTVAFGYYYLEVNPRLRSFEASLQSQGYAVPSNAVEQELEANYGIAVGKTVLFRPDVQYVIDPAGEAGGYVYPGGYVGLRNALVFGFNVTYAY